MVNYPMSKMITLKYTKEFDAKQSPSLNIFISALQIFFLINILE